MIRIFLKYSTVRKKIEDKIYVHNQVALKNNG